MPSKRCDGAWELTGTAALGAVGSALLAFASDVPRSPYGPHAAGVWPFAATGSAGWEGPTVPWWVQPANSGHLVPPARLVATVAAVGGVGLLCIAWLRLWRKVRAEPELALGRLWWVFAAWTVPLLFAAPFASQDVWTYGAQGKLVTSGFSASSSAKVLGHSVWLSGVDHKYLTGPSIYGPGALGLSGLFVTMSGGHPWVAAECWRLAVIAALLLCAWAVGRAASARRSNTAEAVVAAVANPGVLIMFVASIHNDAVMVGLVSAGIALAITKRPWWGLLLAALAVTVKAPAALAVLAIAWWGVRAGRRERTVGLVGGVAFTVVALVLTGLFVGGGFHWVHSASVGKVTSTFSIVYGLLRIAPSRVADVVQLVAIVTAILLVVAVKRRDRWVGALAASFVLMAVCAVSPQPWYLLWALPVLTSIPGRDGVRWVLVLVVTAMTAWSEMPMGTFVWFVGLTMPLWIGLFRTQRWTVPGWTGDLLPSGLPWLGRRRASVLSPDPSSDRPRPGSLPLQRP